MNNGEINFVFCTECGTKNEIDANFCTSCGSKLVKPIATPAPIVIPEPEQPAIEEATEVIATEEPVTLEEPPIEEVAAEEPVFEEAADEEPIFEEAPIEEPIFEEASIEEPVFEESTVEEPVLEEAPAEEITEEEAPVEEETEPDPIPVVIPEEIEEEEPIVEPEEVTDEEVAEEKEEEKEEIPPVIVAPVPVKVSKKEAKLEKKLEEAKKQAEEEARRQAEKEAQKAQKAAEKAEKEAAKAAEKAEKAAAKAGKAEKPAKSELSQNNSHYYYTPENTSTAQAVAEMPKKKRKQNFFLKLLSFLLALILAASLVIAIPITLLNLFLTDHNIDVIVDRAVSSIEFEKIEISTADGAKTLSGAIHDITSEFEGFDYITEEQINEELIEDLVKAFISDTLKGYSSSLKDEAESFGWTPEQLYDFLEENMDTIEKLARDAGYEGELSIKKNKDTIIENIETFIGEEGFSATTILGESDDSKELALYLEAAKALFSRNTLYLAWGLVAFIVILIIFTNLGYFGAFCRSCGFPAFIIGTLYFLVGLAVSPVLSIIGIPIPIFAAAIEFTAGFIGAVLMDISLIVLCTGLGLVIVSFIADAIKRKIDSKKA